MIKQIATPQLKNPIFIAAWPGMGEVAYRCSLFLREVAGFKMFAKLEAQEFFKPAAVQVEKGIISLPSLPAGFFYYYKGKKTQDIILFLGEAQPPLEHAEEISNIVLNFVKRFKAKNIITFAAKPEPIDHKQEPGVWISATDASVLKDFSKYRLKVLEEGQISGLNGIILGVAKNKSMEGVCLLGEIPFYTVQIENPKATAAILEVLGKYLGLNLNLAPLVERSQFVDEEIDKLVGYLKGEGQIPNQAPQPSGPTPLSEDDIDKIKKDLAAYTKLPQSAREKIDGLFKDAQGDIAFASKLKSELDRWNVYKEYEDKFLDLFKKKEKKEDTN